MYETFVDPDYCIAPQLLLEVEILHSDNLIRIKRHTMKSKFYTFL